MPSRDALSKCGGELALWSCSPTSRAWIESSMRFSVGLMKTGKTTPSNYLHRQLDVTTANPYGSVNPITCYNDIGPPEYCPGDPSNLGTRNYTVSWSPATSTISLSNTTSWAVTATGIAVGAAE